MKKIHPTEPQWDSNTEQEIFGRQSPFAADSSPSNTLPPPQQHPHQQQQQQQQQQQGDQYPPAGSSSNNNNHAPAALPTDPPFIFPHYPTQQPYNSPSSQQPRPNNKGSFKNVKVPEDAPPMYTKEPTPIAPPPTPLSIPQPSATAPPSPSPATAGAPQSAHPYSEPHPPQESLPRVLPAQTRQAPFHHPQSPVLHQPSVPPTEQTPLSPQVYSPTTPTSPRQDRPPPPAPQTIPASYGAIRPPHPRGPQRSRPRTPLSAGNSDSESNSSSEDEGERIAAGERRRRRKAIKKHLSGCTCNKICWFLIFLVLLSFWTSPIEKTIKDPCSLMAERRLEPELEIYSIGKASHKDISLNIMEPILGDVTVVEADSWSQDWISVYIYKTFSHPDVSDIIHFSIKFDSSFNNVVIRADLNSTDPIEREREAMIMKNHCARIDIEFVFPKYSDNVKRLFAKTQKGDIRIRTEGTTMIFSELHLETLVGDVLFEAGTVRTSTTIKTGRGKVQGTIRTLEKVEVSTATGDIALVVDARPGLHGTGDNKFNITLQSAKSSIDLGLSEQYTGLFSLESGIDRPTFGLSPNYTNTIRISKKTATSLSGWVWDGFSNRPRSLPSVSATALNGRVHAQVLDKPKKK